MSIEILMPALSPTMTEGNLVKWHKKEGDIVKAGDILAEIETDKATMEVEAVDEGKMGKILIPEGTENVKVNAPIAILLEDGEDASSLKMPAPMTAPQPQKEEAKKPELSVVKSASVTLSSESRVFASPLAKRIAAQNNLNLESLSGSGPRGRIVKSDVEVAIAQGEVTTARVLTLPTDVPGLSGYEPAFEAIPVNNMRKVIAKRLTESKQTVPHFYLTVDCEIDALLRARIQLNQMGDEYKLTVNDFIIRAVGLALKKVPEANASWMGDHMYQFESADVSVAVAIEGGLITPVIRKAETKGLREISLEMRDLASRAREGKLKPEEFQGGTFSISNLGMYGIREFSAIINPPQGCILAIGAGEERPVVKDGQLTIATVMTCTLSVDHRVVDGAVGANFLKAFKQFITDPVTMLL
ncbi:Dihydrolipoyllysine-residue acetyltransferase component of pyruvate dehydrogenase complex [Candidatus Bealeia paramacronuclearis]|uniref:Acetyltransferase component of pyruvate dehydrogenase complex n=1 Tax=Candidatus Bealeia paramacronuclearis TaxID=1921001 RepID=A0ABZ2C3P9_9PROT|nr:Dihydrolipoyllysine-residue acetyltransferase component of pyruvate dehydrogenase complex [Candidatus Bealeia paramacronuclearis]